MRTRGFTLVELMIAVALFGFVASGAMSLVLTAARTQAHSARVDVAQGAVRTGIDFITRDVMMAGAGAKSAAITEGWSGATLLPVSVTNSSTGPDELDVYLVDASASTTATGSVTAASTAIPVLSNAGFSMTGNNVVQLCDFDHAVLLKVNAMGAGTLGLQTPNTFATVFAAGALVFRSRHVTYRVNTTMFAAASTGNASMLTLDLHDGNGEQPVAEGIEDLQVALGFDNDGDGRIAEVGAAAGDDEWVFNVAGETAPASLANLRAVRVTLVAKSTQFEAGATAARPAAEDRAAAAGGDGFFRRVVRTEIAVRNFNL